MSPAVDLPLVAAATCASVLPAWSCVRRLAVVEPRYVAAAARSSFGAPGPWPKPPGPGPPAGRVPLTKSVKRCVSVGGDLIDLRLGEPAGRDRGGELLLLGGDEGGDQARRRLAARRRRHLGERLAGLELGEEVGSRRAEVRRRGGELVTWSSLARARRVARRACLSRGRCSCSRARYCRPRARERRPRRVRFVSLLLSCAQAGRPP